MRTGRRCLLALAGAGALVPALFAAGAHAQTAPYQISPFNHSFGQQALGTTSAPATFTLTVRCYEDVGNPGTCLMNNPFTPNVTVSGDFAIRDNGCTSMMPGNSTFGTSCNFNVVFVPTLLGDRTGIVDVGQPDGFARAGVTGTGVPPPMPVQPIPLQPGPSLPTAPRKRCKKKKGGKRAAAAKKCRKRKR
jgi:hypothetical protein